MLATLIALFGPISGAHFNPAVSIVQAMRRKRLNCAQAGRLRIVQVVGCCRARFLAHAMFDLPLIQASLHLGRARLNGYPRPLPRV